jgi:lactoylglutathione lyase
MVRVLDLDLSLAFFGLLGLQEVRRREVPSGRFTLVYLATGTPGDAAEVELTWNWDQEDPYTIGRSFGHLAFAVSDIYGLCERLEEAGVPVLRPPRDGRMAFVRSPDGISIELLQDGAALPPREPWVSRENQGEW